MSTKHKNISKDGKQQNNTHESLLDIPQDPDYKPLIKLCRSFVDHTIHISATFSFDDKQTPVSNCNTVGDILEDIFYPRFKKVVKSIKVGPKQASPDFWTHHKKFEYEMKTYMKHPGFDIANFSSYISQLTVENGVFRKLFQTKYLVFEYEIDDNEITIKKFKDLNVWNIVGFTGKYPLTLQNKRNMWYNIRPSSVTDWDSKNKTPEMFINNIIKAIEECPNSIKDKEETITNIQGQFDTIKSKYNI